MRSKYPNKLILSLFGGGAEKCVDDMLRVVADNSDEVIFIKSKHIKAIGNACIISVMYIVVFEIYQHRDA